MSLVKKLLKYSAYLIGIFVVTSCIAVVLYKFINPPITPLMIIRLVEDNPYGEKADGVEKSWIDFDDVSKNLFRACIAAEDARFNSHEGVDWKAVEKARKYNESNKRGKVRGASTITMQTAKNVFLWNGRNFIRKGLEAYFTVLIEAVWGKKRILEVYVNVIEWGNGIYGVEAAAQKYFRKSASKLTNREAALLAAVLPNPRKFSPANPSNYIKNRTNRIEQRMNSIALVK